MSAEQPSIWAVVPAAGIGQRFGGDRPKQYTLAHGRPILAWTLDALLAVKGVQGVMVALAPESDVWWPEVGFQGIDRVLTCTGGAARADSVLSGLQALDEFGANDADWVLVHDAARPCVEPGTVDRLIDAVCTAGQGGLLAIPARDTLKRASEADRVGATTSRDGLWQAQTPQMFRIGELRDALAGALADQVAITDESQAMERQGRAPLLVEGSLANLKLTVPSDLALVEAILAARQQV